MFCIQVAYFIGALGMTLVVQKYGGTSVGSIDRIKHVAAHIAKTVSQGDQVVAVISAMGDQTDELLAMAHAISPNPPRRELDMLLTSGERIAMALVSIALNDIGQKAVSLTGSQSGIITDTVHGNARISRIGAHRIQDHLAQGQVVIVAGFQGVSAESKEITTLGRGGSDLSAIALAAALGARCCQLYKDVDGVCSADPRVVPQAKVLPQISWDAMNAMAWAGASVLHPRGAHLAAKFIIPIEIRSSFHLDREGTFVKGISQMEQMVVQAVTHKKNMSVVTGLLADDGHKSLEALRMWLWQRGETPQIQTQMATSEGLEFCWSMPQGLVHEAIEVLMQNRKTIRGPKGDDCALITVIGSGFWQSPETLEKVHRVIANPKLLDVKNNALTVAVANEQLETVLQGLHDVLIG
jgi:aspartate kinase